MATPTLDEFLSAARADNPGVSDGQLANYWLKTYASPKSEMPKPESTAGGLLRSFGSSAIDTVGSSRVVERSWQPGCARQPGIRTSVLPTLCGR